MFFSLSFTTTLLWFSLLAQRSVLAATCSRSYTVQEGDTCDEISATHNVSTYQLATINPDIDQSCSNLTPGQTLCLGTEGEDCTTTHVVVLGDTCEIIQQNVGVNSTVFFHNNPQVGLDCLDLYVGEVVCTAQSVIVPSAGAVPPATTSTTASSPPSNTQPASDPTTTATATGDTSDDNLPFCDEL